MFFFLLNFGFQFTRRAMIYVSRLPMKNKIHNQKSLTQQLPLSILIWTENCFQPFSYSQLERHTKAPESHQLFNLHSEHCLLCSSTLFSTPRQPEQYGALIMHLLIFRGCTVLGAIYGACNVSARVVVFILAVCMLKPHSIYCNETLT
jgi:hypothetical protein